MKEQKIKDLSFFELEDILIESYGKIGIATERADEKLRKACEAIFNYQPNIYAHVVPVMFDMYSAGKIKLDKVKPDVNGYFFAQLKERYFENSQVKKESEKKRELKKLLADKERTAYMDFMKYCEMYRRFPVVTNWVAILKYLVRTGFYTLYKEFEKEPVAIQERTARVHVKKHAHEWFANNNKIAFAA